MWQRKSGPTCLGEELVLEVHRTDPCALGVKRAVLGWASRDSVGFPGTRSASLSIQTVLTATPPRGTGKTGLRTRHKIRDVVLTRTGFVVVTGPFQQRLLRSPLHQTLKSSEFHNGQTLSAPLKNDDGIVERNCSSISTKPRNAH